MWNGVSSATTSPGTPTPPPSGIAKRTCRQSTSPPSGWSSSSTEPLPVASIEPTTASYAPSPTAVNARNPVSVPGGVTPVRA